MWLYNNIPFQTPPEKTIGFVYLITNTQNNKKYIGKKVFHFTKSIQKNLKKKKIKVESDWKTYNGSNEDLLLDIKMNNPTLIKEIIQICYSKSELSYIEAYHQFINNVLIDSTYYNNWISVKVTRRHLTKYKLMLDESNSI
jgi:uncharacterized ubiquitin-like protein YukD